MALLKAIELNKSGVTASYWAVTGFEVDFLANHTKVRVSGWVDAQAKLDGKLPLMHREVKWLGAANPVTPAAVAAGTALSAAYAKLKTDNVNPFVPNNPFVGATDI